MKGFLNDGPAAGQVVEVGDPPIRRGVIVLDAAAVRREKAELKREIARGDVSVRELLRAPHQRRIAVPYASCS